MNDSCLQNFTRFTLKGKKYLYSACTRSVSKALRHALSRDNTFLPAHPAFHPQDLPAFVFPAAAYHNKAVT